MSKPPDTSALGPVELADLPLFPLNTVLFPGGLLTLKVFEARYLDMVSACLRTGSGFGVITVAKNDEVRLSESRIPRFEAVGCIAEIQDCDSDQPGILMLRCLGTQRFELEEPYHLANGLWLANRAVRLTADVAEAPQPDQHSTVVALMRAVQSLEARGEHPFAPPFRYDDAGWVANRWCEILPIQLPARQKLMALPDPHARLRLVDGVLRRHGIVSD